MKADTTERLQFQGNETENREKWKDQKEMFKGSKQQDLEVN